MTEFLQQIESSHGGIRIFYEDEWLLGYEVGPRFEDYSLRRILDELLAGSGITYDFLFDYALIFAKDPSSAIQRESILQRASIQRKVIEQISLGIKDRPKRGRASLDVVVRDKDSGNNLTGVSISINEQPVGITDMNGKFGTFLFAGSYILSINHTRYDDKLIDLDIYDDGEITIDLQETPVMLGEVVIADDQILEKGIGKSALTIAQLKRAPTFLGEADILKHVLSQPGVTSVGELAAGFNVRGGSTDQNLVLFDGVPVFNTSHALGFFTAFNAEAIGGATFYRGGIPANFGGRVSSVLDLTSRDGDWKKWTGTGGVGIISSHLTVGGPIKKDTTTAIIAVRSTYSNWMLRAIRSNYEDVRNTSVNFFDGSIRLTHRIGESKMTLSGYKSHDQFSLADDTTFNWGNRVASLRIDHMFGRKLLSTASVSYGKYDFTVTEEDPATAFQLAYSVTYPSLKLDFQVDGAHDVTFGLHNTWYTFNPGMLRPASEISNAARKSIPRESSLESALYVSDEYNFSDKLLTEVGLRLTLFNRFGPVTVYRYKDGEPREVRTIVDSASYKAGEISKTYAAVEPRFSFRYSLGENSSIKVGYHRMVQYMHLITNTAALTPSDIWQSSNSYFKPQLADQVSAGIFRNFSQSIFETFVEVYYKKVHNTLDFKDGSNLILNPYLETAVISTRGTSFGIELSVSKVTGRLHGSFNYTYSRSFRSSDTHLDKEKINGGKMYPSNNDQPHVANFSWRYGISRRIFFSGTFVFHTGRPVSMPSDFYEVNGIPVSNFSERNQYRLPDYHRLDLALIVEGSHKRKKVWSGNWVISFYNVYARRNAYSAFFSNDGSGFLKPYKLSVIGTVIPSISYNFRF